MGTIFWVILVANIMFSVIAIFEFIAFAKGSRFMFVCGLFNNVYWLGIGLYYGWHANIAITCYFVIVNIVGFKIWHAGFKSLRRVWLLLVLFMAIALYTNLQVGFVNLAAKLNFINVGIYGVAYTLRLYKSKSRVAAALMFINRLIYLPTMALANPILWGCVVRQSIMLIPYYALAFAPNSKLTNAIKNLQITIKTKTSK